METKKKKTKKVWHILGIILAAIVVLVIVSNVSARKQAEKREMISEMLYEKSSEECLNYILETVDGAVITIGTIKDGQAEWTVYGSGGVELPKELHDYEIGSITKTVTASLIAEAVSEGLVNIDDTIDVYLDLPGGNTYPTVRQLLTHTSGYQREYYSPAMIWRACVTPSRLYDGITKDTIMKQLAKHTVSGETYPWAYSNFGVAVLGLILENVYGKSYTVLANDFLYRNGMINSEISTGKGDLGNLFVWGEDNGYMPAGAVISNIEDMLKYAQLQLDNDGVFAMTHETISEVKDAAEEEGLEEEARAGMYLDEIGMLWFKDEHNGFIWHAGTTMNYRAYLGFCPETNTAVVILSNLVKNPDIAVQPPSLIGSKLLKELQSPDASKK